MNAQYYDVEEWAAGTTAGRRVFNHGYGPSSSEFRGWRLLKVVTMHQDRDVEEKTFMFESASDPKEEMLRVGVTERYDWRLAQESLHRQLMECMRADMPKGTKKLAQVGDVVFVSRDPLTDAPGAVYFVRGNVCVSVSSAGTRNVDVSDFAFRIDRALSEPPAKSELDKGTVRASAPRAATVLAKKPFVLIEKLPAATPRGGWLKVTVPDGELRRKGDALIYVSPEGGRKRVNTFVARRS